MGHRPTEHVIGPLRTNVCCCPCVIWAAVWASRPKLGALLYANLGGRCREEGVDLCAGRPIYDT